MSRDWNSISITGVGMVTPLGADVEQTWRGLLEGRFISDHAKAAGEFDGKSPRVIQMAQRAADEAMAQAGWSKDDSYTTIVGTSKGSVEGWLRSSKKGVADRSFDAGGIDCSGLGDIAAELAYRDQPRMTVSAACASSLIALIRGAMLIQAGHARRVLVVGAEASVHPLFLGSFNRLGLLASPEIGCRPFDETRDGFLMSEVAGAICLEAHPPHHHAGFGAESDNLDSSDAQSCCVLVENFAMSADAVHLTGVDPTGRGLKRLISTVTRNQKIDLIHAHGTGTIANDPVELEAIASVFANATNSPLLYSHKGALGHSLGASGLLAVIINTLAHRHAIIPGNIRTTHPLPTRRLSISQSPVGQKISRSIVLAAGFGGASAAVSLVTL